MRAFGCRHNASKDKSGFCRYSSLLKLIYSCREYMSKARHKLRAYKCNEPRYSEGNETLQKRESSCVLFHGITVYESVSQLQTI